MPHICFQTLISFPVQHSCEDSSLIPSENKAITMILCCYAKREQDRRLLGLLATDFFLQRLCMGIAPAETLELPHRTHYPKAAWQKRPHSWGVSPYCFNESRWIVFGAFYPQRKPHHDERVNTHDIFCAAPSLSLSNCFFP